MDPKLQDYLITRVEKIDEKVDKLLAFKWQIIGGAGFLSILVTLLIQVLSVVFSK